MLKLVRAATSAKTKHEDQFLQHYEWLHSWAMKLAHDDADSAGDLLQTAFVQFCLRNVDLDLIDNIEAYFYTMLRNLRLSQLRMAARVERRNIPIGEYDTIDIGLRAIDPAFRLQACVDLSFVCDWACQRKETSKAASVLILRFFHGYEPSEIAAIIGGSARIVAAWLQVARRDLRASLGGDRNKNSRFEICTTPRNSGFVDCATTIDELRARIFASHQGPCLTEREVSRLYGERSQTIRCSRLAHIVSCQDCLKRAAMRLDLPQGPDGPFDMSGSTTPMNKTTSGRNSRVISGQLLRRWRRSLQDVLEHGPSELRLGVDGFIVGVLKVHSEISEISVEVSLETTDGFVEVFSSQGVQMLHFELSPPPIGAAQQSTFVEFAEGRSLTVTADFTRPKPVIDLRYCDPLFVDDPDVLVQELPEPLPEPVFEDVQGSWWKSVCSKWRELVMLPAMPIRKTAVGVAIILVIACLWWFRQLTPTPVFAAELLRKASRAEQTELHAANTASYRTLRIQESADGRAIKDKSVEIWYSAVTKIRAVRVYDEQNQLEAGEWTKANGSRTVYRHGGKTTQELASTTPPMNSQNIWRWEPTAEQFTALVSGLTNQKITEQAGSWTITYQREASSPSTPLLKATLVLDKAHLRATKQTLVLQEDGTTREFLFTENIHEQFNNGAIDQSHFVPEPELTNLPLRPAVTTVAALAKPLTGTDLDKFEMALTYQLHLLEPCLAGHPAINMAVDGRLIVDASAKSAQCDTDVKRNLTSFAGPSVAAMRVLPMRATERPAPLRSEDVGRIGGYDLFSNYFGSRVLDPDNERGAIRQKAAWATERSRSIVYHAEALAELTRRWNVETLRKLDLDTVHQWQTMVQAHATELSREEQVLRRELQPIFFPNVSSAPAAAVQPMNTLGDIPPVVDELVALAMLQDETIRLLCGVPEEPPARVLDPVALGSSFDRAIAVAGVLTKKWPLDP
jgi:RNA polymerase sigma factor (sigma-70 family)